jgi:hypothetical protein
MLKTKLDPQSIRGVNTALIIFTISSVAMIILDGSIREFSWQLMITQPIYLSLAIAILLLIICHQLSTSVLKLLHILFLSIATGLLIFSNSLQILGTGFLLLLFTILIQYGVLNSWWIIKAIIMTLLFFKLTLNGTNSNGGMWDKKVFLIYIGLVTIIIFIIHELKTKLQLQYSIEL